MKDAARVASGVATGSLRGSCEVRIGPKTGEMREEEEEEEPQEQEGVVLRITWNTGHWKQSSGVFEINQGVDQSVSEDWL